MPMRIKDIAEKAEVSPATVSMVLNNKAGISPETRNKVLNVVSESGYSKSILKEALIKNKGSIQLIVYKKHSRVVADTPFFQQLIEGVESKARNSGYQLLIKYISGGKPDINALMHEADDNQINGLLILGTEMDYSDIAHFMSIKMPFIFVDSYFLGVSAGYVVINNTGGSYIGTKYLLEKGHTEIGYLKSSIPIQNFLERYEGYYKALLEKDLPVESKYCIPLGPSMEDSYEDMKCFLKKNTGLPTAFIADNDLIAFGAMKALRECGVKIPDDVSVIGFDDMPFCNFSEPPLTTIGVDKKLFGKLAVDNLVSLMENKVHYNTKTVMDVELIERSSVAQKQR